MPDDALIASLLAAVAAAPSDVVLRRHLAERLVDAGRGAEALAHLSQVLAAAPADVVALELLARATGQLTGDTQAMSVPAALPDPTEQPDDGFDWEAVQHEFDDVLAAAGLMERPSVCLDDVGGMTEVKARLHAAFLAPMRNPELRLAYRKSLRGGLLLYGPPGCGKTFLARAVAGELGAAFRAVSLADVLDMWVGNSEKNVQQLFRTARSHAPCVLFLDEIDALGHKRSQLSNTGMRGTVNQLLTELDSVEQDNEGVFVLAATNAPWDVDPALRRPGRFDRTLLVLPPDVEARRAILQLHLQDRPVASLDLDKIVKATEDFSGADLAHLVEGAAEHAMLDAAASGTVRSIDQRDFARTLKEVRPTTGAWLQSARNIASFGNESGEYDDLVSYLRKRRLL
jgi:SpoVK/Ycf46/Vps4 family AAA+-type ATPase